MNITFSDKKKIFIQEDLRNFKTVKVESAIIPFAWYNVKNSYENNYFRYMIIDVDNANKMLKEDVITISEGYYNPDTFNKAIQKKLKAAGHTGAVSIDFLEDQGRIRIRRNPDHPEFVPMFHKELINFLGFEGYEGVITGELISTKLPKFFNKQYNIDCNIIDSSKNINNGNQSKRLATFVPKLKKYGETHMFKSMCCCDIESYNFSSIKIEITNEDDQVIDFHLPFIVTLKLE